MVLPRKQQRPDRFGRARAVAARDGDGEPIRAADLRAKAIALLGRREHSRVEMRGKLVRAGGDAETVETLLDVLEGETLLSDQRFAEGLARVRGARFGSRRVAYDLRRTGVGIEGGALVDELRATDLERAREVWQRKFGAVPTNADARAKQMRFLLSRGFPTDVIYRVVPRPGSRQDDD